MIQRPKEPLFVYSLWGITLIAWATIGVTLYHTHDAMVASPPLRVAMTDTVMTYDPSALTRAADSVIGTDLFRLERHPTQVAFGTPPVAGPSTVPPQHPQLAFGGIIGGPPWRAILSGVPNHDGSLVIAPGDTFGGLRVRAIRHDTVIVQGRDTMWTFTVRH